MKILVFSDSHRSRGDMIEAIDEQQPDQVIHLGDLITDAEELTYVYPRLPICMVPGNCDGWTTEPVKKLITLQGKTILLSHGHLWRVKGSYDAAIADARKAGADILLFGHTHRAYCQQLEDGQITVSRAAGSATYPSRFQLVAAMNPCKCGYYGHPTRPCTCSPSAVRQYRSRVSGPLLDRIDLCVEMDPVAFDELHTSTPAESSADLRKQVLAARAVQAKRYAAPGYEGVRCNAQLTAGQVRRVCRMTPAAERLLRASYDTLGLSARAHDRILRVARTVADLAGKQLLDEASLLEALQYRAQEKVETF